MDTKNTIAKVSIVLMAVCIAVAFWMFSSPRSLPLQDNEDVSSQEKSVDGNEMDTRKVVAPDENKEGEGNMPRLSEAVEHLAYNIVARNDADYARLLALLAKMGLAPDNVLPQLRAVALMTDSYTMKGILAEMKSLHFEQDFQVSKPIEHVSSGMTPFRKSLLDWLKIDKSDTSRGNNVKIAVIDEPLTATESTANAAIKQIDMFSLAGQGTSDHGNSIASILVSNADYLQGIVPGASILSIPVVDGNGTGSSFNLAAAIVAAVDNGANIISISLCSDGRSSVLENAVNYANEKGCVVVAAAGNDGEHKNVYPASFANVISVSACDATGTVTSFSNYGSKVDICAPGVGIVVDDSEPEADTLALFSGTSAATPCVAGVIACIMWENPSMSAIQAAELVQEKAVDEGELSKDVFYGNGVLSYQRASLWENDNFTDVAATGHYFDLKAADNGTVPLHLNAQNTGNVKLGCITLNYSVNDQSGTATFYDVMPGASVSKVIQVPLDEQDEIKVSTSVATSAEEHNLDNNTV
ncbi:MAG: S8 family serine peptidase, partial [Victivallales bacterium]|nr:S8 family serine peptidase [Victivallales bacterium]